MERYRSIIDGRRRVGASSARILDPSVLLGIMDLQEGEAVADLGCGAGDFTFPAALAVGSSGTVYAIDHSAETIDEIRARAAATGLRRIEPIVADLAEAWPLEAGTMHSCLLCFVLHCVPAGERRLHVFREFYRVMRPGASAFIVECKKEPASFGPPIAVRISGDEMDELANHVGLRLLSSSDLGTGVLRRYGKPSE